jgi:transcriptional regulator with XRE-family HTH domain
MVLTRLKENMEDRQVSTVELADKAIMSVRSIENAMRKKGASLGTCKRIAKGLGMKLDDLV